MLGMLLVLAVEADDDDINDDVDFYNLQLLIHIQINAVLMHVSLLRSHISTS